MTDRTLRGQYLVVADDPPGDARAAPSLEELYAAHFDRLWRLCRRLGVEERDLEDVVQDTFVVVQKRLPSFDTSRPASAWLSGITWRVVSEYRRRGRRRPAPSATQPDELEAPSGDDAARALLRQALFELRPERRDVVVLHDLEGHTVPEISQMSGVKVNTLYSRLRLGREDLVVIVRRLQGEAL